MRVVSAVGGEAEVDRGIAPRLGNRLGEIDGPGVDARGRAGLQPAQVDAQHLEALRQPHRGEFAGAPALVGGVSHNDAPAQGCAGGQYHRPAFVRLPEVSLHPETRRGATVGVDAVYLLDQRLLEVEVGLSLQDVLHGGAVEPLVALGPGRLHGRPLAGVQHADLDEGLVGDLAHLAAEGVDLADEVALGRAADGGVAGHEGDVLQVHAEEEGPAPHAGGRQRCLAAGVAGADHDDVVHLDPILQHALVLGRSSARRLTLHAAVC